MRKNYMFFPILALALGCFLFLVTDRSLLLPETAIAQEETEENAEEEEEVTYVGKDMQVLKFTSMVELQTYMKEITDSLGVDCKYCHNLRAFEETNEELHKDEAREMMLMQKEINEKFLKDYSIKVTCYTCHRGHEQPATDEAAWLKQSGQAEEEN